jgi:hypothetical protein
MDKHNCYTCKFRGTVTGSAHSRCNFVKENYSGEETHASLLEISLATGTTELTVKETKEPLVKMNETGIRGGWATWPIDFDPIWVDKCLMYKAVEDVSK